MKTNSYGLCPYKIKDNEFYILLNKTSKNSNYNFFKGKIEDLETPQSCAKREFFEETGVDTNINYYEEFFSQNSKRKLIGVYLIDWSYYEEVNFSFDKKEIYSGDWIKLSPEIIFSKNQQKIFNKIFLFLKQKEMWLKHIIV